MKSILLHVHEDSGQESRLQAALDLARALEGHITCVQVTALQEYVTVDPFGGTYMLPTELSFLREQEAAERTRIEERLGREDVPWDWRHNNGELARTLLNEGRLADILVVSLPPDGKAAVDAPLPIAADLALMSPVPVLCMPVALNALDCDGRALIAWDGSHEASHALRLAVPLLSKARDVHIVTVEEAKSNGFPSTEASEYLSRHGISSVLHEWPRRDHSVEEALFAAAAQLNAAYLVMGAFGHSRLRETIFGGVTRHMLAHAPVPLLIAH